MARMAAIRRVSLAAAVALAAGAAGGNAVSTASVAPQGTVTTCGAANPFDHEPDDAALQVCLDNFDWVLLTPDNRPGYVGYIVSDTVKLRRNHVLLTTAEIPRKVTMLAAPSLTVPMFRATIVTESGTAASDYEISFIRFDGNRENRQVRDRPCDAAHLFGNVQLSGDRFHIRYVESIGAVCGSAMTVGGAASFEIADSIFADNGRQPEEANGISGLWADGLTVFGCRGGTVRDNALWDNTDVDLGVNGGPGCAVYRNTISHAGKYAFAGLVAGDPSQSGGEFSDNVVSSGYNMLGFGIILGCHPWGACKGGYAANVSLHDNTSTGAVVNLAVDGVNGGLVENNRFRFAQGDRVLNCPGRGAEYTASHFFDLRALQPGYVLRNFDFGSDCR